MRLLFIFRFIICLLFQQNIQHFIYAYQRIFLISEIYANLTIENMEIIPG